MGQFRLVDFEKYCKFCKFKDVDDTKGENPCNDCLNNPANEDSTRPVNFELNTDKYTEEDLKEDEEIEEGK